MTEFLCYFEDDSEEGILPIPMHAAGFFDFQPLTLSLQQAAATELVDFDDRVVGNVVHGLGGGISTLSVSGIYEIATAGDAISWALGFFSHLGKTLEGTLVLNGIGWYFCHFVSGNCSFVIGSAYTYAQYKLTFIRSVADRSGDAVSFQPPTEVEPDVPNIGNSDGSYAFGARHLGSHAVVNKVSVSRPSVVHNIPRAHGVRVRDFPYGRKLSLDLTVYSHPSQGSFDSLQEYRAETTNNAHSLSSSFTFHSQKNDLRGEGSIYENCVLTKFSRKVDDNWRRYTVGLQFELESDHTPG